LGFTALVLFLGTPAAQAGPVYSIGNQVPHQTSDTFFIQGQSFTPSVQGDRGSGTPTASPSGTVLLTQFSVDFNLTDFEPPPPPAVLYIYAFAPTVAQVDNNGQGSLGAGTLIDPSGVYGFSDLELSFGQKYFAVLPASRSIYDIPDSYDGGADLFPQAGAVAEGGFDAGFTATFTTVPGPSSLALLGAGILVLLGHACRRRTRLDACGVN
jgi:hypothetical protein